MLRQFKKGISALLATAMVFSSWAMAWADTGADILSDYQITLKDKITYSDYATFSSDSGLIQDSNSVEVKASAGHSKLVLDDNDEEGVLYIDQGPAGSDPVSMEDILNGYFEEHPDADQDAYNAARDELIKDHDPLGLKGKPYVAILHIEGDPDKGDVRVTVQDPTVGSNKRWSLFKVNQMGTDNDFILYANPGSSDETSLSITQSESSAVTRKLTVKKAIPFTEFFIREEAVLGQSEGQAIASYENGKVNSIQSIECMCDDEFHFVFDRTKTLAGTSGDTVVYKLEENNGEVDGAVTVTYDDETKTSAKVKINGDLLDLSKPHLLVIDVNSSAFDEATGAERLTRPLIAIGLDILPLKPFTAVDIAEDTYEISTVKTPAFDLAAEIATEPADAVDRLIYTSSDENVATVDENGVITAVGPGTVTVTAASEKGAESDSCEITVKPDVTSIVINDPSEIVVGEEKDVEFTVVPAYDAVDNPSDPEDVTWSSEDDTILTVTQDTDGSVKIAVPDTADLGGKTSTKVKIFATTNYGVENETKAEKEITVYTNTATTAITNTVEQTDTDPVNLSKSLNEITAGEEYSIYDGQSVKITSDTKGTDDKPTIDTITWKATIGSTITDADLTDSKVQKWISTSYDPDTKELSVTFLDGKNGDVILTAYADSDDTVRSTVTFHVNKKTTGLDYSASTELDQLVAGQEFTVDYTLQPNDSLNVDSVYVESSDDTVLEVTDYATPGTISLKAVGAGNAKILVYATYDNALTGSDTTYYTYIEQIDVVVKKDIKDAEISAISDKIFKNARFTVEDIADEVVVKHGGTTLVSGTDYDLAITDGGFDVGTCTVTVTGKGASYAGSAKVTFEILPYDVTGSAIEVVDPDKIFYTGLPVEPEVKITVAGLNDVVLKAGTDYALSYTSNTDVAEGPATVTATATGNYTGTLDTTFDVLPRAIGNTTVVSIDTLYEDSGNRTVYTGAPIEPTITAKNVNTGDELVEGTDYELSYEDNENIGFAHVIVTGKGNYDNTTMLVFEIVPHDFTDVDIEPIADLIYNGEDQCPEPKVTFDGNDLVKDVDYELSWSDNRDVGTGHVTVTGIGNFDFSETCDFAITEYELTEANTEITYDRIVYNGLDQTPELVVKIKDSASPLNGTVIARADDGSADYKVAYSDNIDATEEAIATITATNNYTGEFDFKFTISRAPITEIEIDDQPNMVYTGDALEPDISARFIVKSVDAGGYPVETAVDLVLGTDYDLAYDNNFNASNTSINSHMAKITIKATKNFIGSTDIFFTIDPLDIGDATVTVDPIADETYDLDYHTPDPVVNFDNGNGVSYVMKPGEDYEVDWNNNFDATTAAEVNISGLNNFTSSRIENFVINPYDIEAANTDGKLGIEFERVVYNGLPQTPEFTIVVDDADNGFKGYYLFRNDKGYGDFTVAYTDNVNAVDDSKVTITGTGNYTGSFDVDFDIVPAEVTDSNFVITKLDDIIYDGAKHTPEIEAKWMQPDPNPDVDPTPVDLVKDTDYTLDYGENTNAGTADVIVTGTGNFKGTKTIHFTIERKDISADDVAFTAIADETYTTKEITPFPEIVYNEMTLVNGKDVSCEYKDNVNAGTALVTVTGIGNYKGSKDVEFTILPYELTADNTKVTIDAIEYTGVAREPAVTVFVNDFDRFIGRKDNGTADFKISYKDNVNAGNEAVATVTGTKNYTGEFDVKFTIDPANVSNMSIKAMDDLIYNGAAQEPDINATNKVTQDKLVSGTDYELEYKNNENVGTAIVTVKGLGNYTGTRTVNFRIAAESIANTKIADIEDQVYAFGKAIKPSLTITFADKTLVEGKDYRVVYKDNIDAGTATVTITGIGNFGSTKAVTFKITPFELTDFNADIAIDAVSYDGTAKTPNVTVTVKDSGRVIARNDMGTADFKVTYSDNTASGQDTASAVITGTNNFTGSVTKKFTINAVNIDYAGAESIPAKNYTGKEITPKVNLTYKTKKLVEGTDYEVAYSNNIESGEAKITITGIGNFYGTKIMTFKIKTSPILFNAESITVVAGETAKIPYTASEKVKFTSSNKKICKVSSDGTVMGLMAGQVTVTAKSESGVKKTITVQVLYKDVTSEFDFWYKPCYYLTNNGVVKGYDNQTNFKPANECTRAQMVTFLWRLEGSPKPESDECKFSDVKESDYFYKAVLWASEKKVVEGYKDGTFGPKNVCQRKHAVTFMWRLAGKPKPTTTKNKFSDVKKSDYFYKAVLWASEMKIVEGYKGGLFKPEGNCLRRQMVTFLYKYDKYVNGKG
ncbi:MAG: S-layer homology domain-containing protein [Clostridiales bacterium]|nr:S-layer homology domain-containing protein [Clostridiales bacterium]